MATTITANGINFPDGSAGTPSIGGSDTNTGLFTGSDIIGFATGGSERLKIDASGNVNIANDSGKLQLGASNDLQIYHDGTNTYLDNNTGQFNIDAASGNAIRFLVNGSYQCQVYTSGIDLPDNKKLRLGDSEDLQIVHNGVDSQITDTGTGSLALGGSAVFIQNASHNANMASFVAGAEANLFHNGTKKFETNSAGVKVTGQIEADEVYLRDSEKILLGTGSDLQIFHNGSQSKIVDNTGNELRINANTIRFRSSADDETYANFIDDGAVELYHNNSKKFETMSTGAYVEGYLAFPDTGGLKIGSGNDLQIFHTGGSHSQIADTTGHQLYITADNALYLQSYTGSENYIKCVQNGAVELYYDNSKKFETTNTGGHFTGKFTFNDGSSNQIAFGDSEDLQIYHDGSDSFIKDTGTGGIRVDTNQFVVRSADGNTNRMIISDNGALNVQGVYSQTTSSGANVNVASDGHIRRSTSSRRYKNTITDATHGLTELLKLKSVTFKGNEDGDIVFGGLIAEDVHDAGLTEFVHYDKDNKPDALAYGNMVALCVKAIQDLNFKLEALEAA